MNNFEVKLPDRYGEEFNIRDYGAVPDGKVSNTKAFAAAITEASEKGGKVVVPGGIWWILRKERLVLPWITYII